MTDSLNASQREAVTTPSGPLLVLAGAGTGKTRVVTHRIAELMRRGTPPARILAVTFTNKAAAEMQERIRALLGRRLKQRPQISTFHAHCVQILRRHIRKLDYPQNFAIYDRGDQESLARRALREVEVPGQRLRPGDLLQMISCWKAQSVRPPSAAARASSDREHLAAMAYRRYQRALKNAGAVDFDDLLLCTEDLFAKFPDVRREEAARFDHVLVDEYQDTNASQYRIVKALAEDHRNLCVVGDDDQSIYGWRGADVTHILRFSRDWPEAKVVRLEENYRSTAKILDLANRLIVHNMRRHQKVLRAARPGGQRPRIEQYRDESSEARAVVEEIGRGLARPGCEPRDFAVLFRTNEQPRAFETELRRVQTPYVVLGGMSFFDRKEVRDVLAYLKLLQWPRDDVALLRIINTPPRGIGSSAVKLLREQAARQGQAVWEVASRKDATASLSAAAAHGLSELTDVLRDYRKQAADPRRGRSLAAMLQAMMLQIDYRSEIERLYDEPQQQDARWRGVEEVVNAVAAYEKTAKSPSLAGFLREEALETKELDNDNERQLRRNAVALMTLHSAKGLEFPYVYMVGMEEGLLPHHRSVKAGGEAIDEERRLCYVGVTRAQEQLALTMALTRMKWGKPRETTPSRFLYEMLNRPPS